MPRRSPRRPLRTLAAALALLALAADAGAHALLVEAIPSDSSRLTAAPSQLVLRFNSRIEHGLSGATLLGEAGMRRALPVDADAPPDRLVAPFPALGPGTYTVEWQVLSVDGHRAAGRLGFTIVGPG